MQASIGIPNNNLLFELKGFEGILLFHVFPSTIIHEDTAGNPIIKEWVDCSDDNLVDRFYYYRTSKILLKQFIDGDLPHREIINQAIDGFVVFEDVGKNIDPKYGFAPVAWLPEEYLPQRDFYFDKADGVELSAIVDQFNLNVIELKQIAVNQAKEISTNKKSETLYIHLNKGKGIGFGTANTQVLAKTLLKFDDLYKEAALDYKLGTNRGDIDLSAKKNEEYLPFTNTEVYGNIAASFALLLRPIFQPIPLFGKSDSENISASIFSLIGKSETAEDLKGEYGLHSDFTMKSYRSFVEEIYKQELDVNINWFSPTSTTELSNKIDYKKANLIKYNLDNLTIQSEDKFTVKGKFRSINCDTVYFTFISTGGEKFHGYFDKLIKDGSETVNFIDVYEIIINRTLTKEAGKQEGKITDLLLAFTKE